MKTKLPSNELVMLAAILGGTNLGMPAPKAESVQRFLKIDDMDLDRAVMLLWSGYMESDEMYDMFLKECKWWLKDKDNLNKGKSKCADPAYVRKVWPDVAKTMGWTQ